MTDYDTVLSTLGRQEADAWARLAAQYQLAADWDLDASLLDGCLTPEDAQLALADEWLRS